MEKGPSGRCDGILVQPYRRDCGLFDGFPKFKFTEFYETPSPQQRHDSWKLLHSLANQPQLAWFVSGDFNEILNLSKNEGGLADMGFTGCQFTWPNNKLAPYIIHYRLDRICINILEGTSHPNKSVHHLEYNDSIINSCSFVHKVFTFGVD